jgi:hypothetical protein
VTDASMNDSLSTSDHTILAISHRPDFLGAVLTNAQASIRGAAIFGARQETIRKDATIQVNVGQPSGLPAASDPGSSWIVVRSV